MKKVMFCLIAMAVAVVAQAGVVKWSATNVYGSDGATKNAGIAYLFCVDDVSVSDMTSALANGTSDAVAAYVSSAAMETFTPTTAGNYSTATGSGTAYATGSHSFYAVIFDGSDVASSTGYYMTTTKSATIPGSGAATVSFGNQSSATFGKQAWSSTGWSDPTPEPTSGMLLLLGGALLALRRKQK